MVFPLARHFAETVIRPTGQLTAEVKSLCALRKVLDGFLATKQT